MNDVAYDGVSSDQGLTYLSNFGKIFKGEQFKTILTIMNISTIYKLERLRMRVIIGRTKNSKSLMGNGDQLLLDKYIDTLHERNQQSFPL
jgi:hypothetical protein